LQHKEKRNDTSKTAGCAYDDALWIVDSTCSYHVCINRALFNTYEQMQNGGTVQMIDNSFCEVVGMGTVQIKMFDEVVHTLTEVRHIPSMSRNLFSLSTLYTKGYKYYIGDDTLKVTNRSHVVMKGDLTSVNLYVL
jgi:hypothetical protein